jgi:hypothetical protein
MMRIRHWSAWLLAILALLICPACSSYAETILIAVTETVDGAQLLPPLPVREAVAASLFDSGAIVFDIPESTPPRGPEELLRAAQAGGADLLLVLEADYLNTKLASGLVRIAVAASFALIDAVSGKSISRGEADLDNRDHERDMNREALGKEMGRLLAGRIAVLLSARAR